jgi:hypothetical protein
MAYDSELTTFEAPSEKRADPGGWYWSKEEPLVAEYMNFLIYHASKDILHLVDVTEGNNGEKVANADKVDGFEADELGGFSYVQSSTPTDLANGGSWYKDSNGLLYISDGSEYDVQPDVNYQEETDFNSSTIYPVTHEVPPRTFVDPNGNIRLIEEQTVVNFEDGIKPNHLEWSWPTPATLTQQTGTIISGTASGELPSSGATEIATLTRKVGIIQDFEATVQMDLDVATSGDYVRVSFSDDGGTRIGFIRFNDNSGPVVWTEPGGGTTTELLAGWDPNTNYVMEVDWDFPNDQADVTINGTTVTVPLNTNANSNYKDVEFTNETSNSGSARSVFIDDLHTGAREAGEVVLSPAIPDHNQGWDIFDVDRTFAGETITIDVEDPAGNVLISDISPREDLSTAINESDNFQLRCKFSRSNNANQPQISRIFRRWTLRAGKHGLTESEKNKLRRNQFVISNLNSR